MRLPIFWEAFFLGDPSLASVLIIGRCFFRGYCPIVPSNICFPVEVCSSTQESPLFLRFSRRAPDTVPPARCLEPRSLGGIFLFLLECTKTHTLFCFSDLVWHFRLKPLRFVCTMIDIRYCFVVCTGIWVNEWVGG